MLKRLMARMRGSCALLALAVPVAAPSGHAGCGSDPDGEVVITVAPDGDDGGTGDADHPFATLARAQARVRELTPDMDGDVVVDVRAGTYVLDQPLWLDAARGDSGEHGHRVVYQAHGHGTADAETVVLSGGVTIQGWEPTPFPAIWRADVGALETRQLYVDGARAPRAAQGYGLPGVVTPTDTGYVTDSVEPQSWRRPQDIELVYTGGLDGGLAYAQARCGVAAIAAVPGGTAITMDEPCFGWLRDGFTFDDDDPGTPLPLMPPNGVENSPSFLGEGAWYLDRSVPGHHRLLYRPAGGGDPRTATVIAPALETLVGGAGSAEAPLHDVTFRGLTFADATWLAPDEPSGFVHVFGAFYYVGKVDDERQYRQMPGNVDFRATRGLIFEGNRFTRLGAQGLVLADAGDDHVVRGNVFEDISGGGVDVRGVTAGSRHTLIDNNWVHAIGAEYRGGLGIAVGEQRGATVSHNQVDHVPYTGIMAYEDQRGVRILANRVFATVQVLPDGGGIYLSAAQGTGYGDGAVVRDNLVYDVVYPELPRDVGTPNAIYVDNGSDWVSVEHNALYDNHQNLGGVGPHHVRFTGNHWDDPRVIWYGPSCDVELRDNLDLAPEHGAEACAADAACAAIVADAGLEPAFRDLLGRP